MGSVSVGVMAMMLVLGLVLLVAWILLPFAMFGLKPLPRELINEQRKTNELLAKQRSSTS